MKFPAALMTATAVRIDRPARGARRPAAKKTTPRRRPGRRYELSS